jgi:hypothetical protein
MAFKPVDGDLHMADSSHPFDEWLRVPRIDRISELSDAITKVREAESTSEEACEEAKDQTEHE